MLMIVTPDGSSLIDGIRLGKSQNQNFINGIASVDS